MGRYRFPGLRAFEENEAAIFNGREQEKRVLFDLIMVERAVVMFAKSGAGKSSLIRAGIIPMLAGRPFEAVYIRLNRGKDKDSMVEQLGRQIAQVFGIPYSKDQTLWEYLQKINLHTGNVTPILFFDQFEEFFTLYKPAERRELTEQLADLLNETLPQSVSRRLSGDAGSYDAARWMAIEKPPRVRIVFAIRSDRLSMMHDLSEKIPGVLRNRFELTGLHRDQAVEAITRPAGAEGTEYACPPFVVAPDALQEILDSLMPKATDDITEEPEIESFQLQLVCHHLEEKMLEQHGKGVTSLRVTTETFGGQAGIERLLADFYKNALQAIPDAGQRHSAQVNIEDELIKGNSRIMVAEASLLEGENAMSADTLHLLVNNRLLRREERPGGGNYYELSHDTLLAPVMASREERRIREAEEIRTQRHRRISQIATGFALLGLALAAVIYFVQKQIRLNQLFQSLISESRLQTRQDPALAFRLAEAAYDLDSDHTAALGGMIHTFYGDLFELNDTLYATPFYREFEALWVKAIPGDTNGILMLLPDSTTLLRYDPARGTADSIRLETKLADAALSPDGNWLVTLGADATARLFNTDEKNAPPKILAHKALSVTFSSDGRWFCTKGPDSLQRLWSNEGELRHTFTSKAAVDLVKQGTAFSPDSRVLLISETDSIARLFPLTLGQVPATIQPGGNIRQASFSPDGRHLALLFVQDWKNKVLVHDRSGLQRSAYGLQYLSKVEVNNSSWVLACSETDTVQVLDNTGVSRMLAVSGTGAAPVSKSAFAPEGDLVAYNFDDKTIRIRDLKSNIELLSLPQRDRVDRFFFSAGQRYLVVSTVSRKVQVWSLLAHPVAQVRPAQPFYSFFMPGTSGIAVQALDSVGWKWVCGPGVESCPDWLAGSVEHAVPWGDGHTLLLQDTSGRLSRVRANDGNKTFIGTVPKPQCPTYPPAVAGDRIAIATINPGCQIIRVMRSDGAVVDDLMMDAAINTFDLSPDGRRIAVSLADSLVLAKKLTDTRWDTLRAYSRCLMFAADGNSLLIGGNGKVFRWDHQRRQVDTILQFQHDAAQPVLAIAGSPDGRLIATGSSDRNLVLWDAEGKWLHTFTIPARYGGIYRLAFSADGRYLLSQHDKDAVFRWSLDPGDLRDQMKNARNLSEVEKTDYGLK